MFELAYPVLMHRVLVIVVFCMLMTLPAQADFWDGFVAYRRGDYETAHREWYPQAEQGNVDAQFFLGAMYYLGEGVPQDNHQAAKWFGLAAEQGLAAAQFHLGIMYRTGEGVPQNFVESLKWLNLSAAQGYEFAIEVREIVAKHMTPSQKERAQILADQWAEEHP